MENCRKKTEIILHLKSNKQNHRTGGMRCSLGRGGSFLCSKKSEMRILSYDTTFPPSLPKVKDTSLKEGGKPRQRNHTYLSHTKRQSFPLFLKAIGAGKGILEEWDFWDRKGQHGKDDTDQAKNDERLIRSDTARVFFCKKFGFQIKGRCGGNEEYGDIQPVCRQAKDSGIGVVYGRNQRKACQDAD